MDTCRKHSADSLQFDSESSIFDNKPQICCDEIFGNRGERLSGGGRPYTPPECPVEKLKPFYPAATISTSSQVSILRNYPPRLRNKPMRYRCPLLPVKPKKKKKSTLGSPVGVSFGSFNLNYIAICEEQKVLQGYASCLIAFGEIFITPENEWSMIVINHILEDARKLIENSLVTEKELQEANVYKKFVLCSNTMEVEIYEPTHIGKVTSEDITTPCLKDSLRKYFAHGKYCLLWIGEYYFLLWKTCNLYFCFDCYGRIPRTCKTDLLHGFASLVCVRSTDNLAHLIVNLSCVNGSDMYTIRRIRMMKLLKCCAKAELFDDHERKFEYNVINDKYATLSSHLHLGSECFREYRYKQSLALAIIALVYAKIDAPCTWDRFTFDQVIILGSEYYKKWTFADRCFDLGIQDIPGRFEFGQFTIDIIVTPIQESGQWQCIPNYKQNSLMKSIRRCLEKSPNIIVQIERKAYPIWRRNSYYYVLDPFEHHAIACSEKTKSAVLHMFSSLNVMCCQLTRIILEIPSSRPYYIHTMKIFKVVKTRNLKELTEPIECSCITKRPDINQMDEIKSMNESLIDVRCKKEFYCLLESGDIEEDYVADLDSPGLSETQILKDYDELRGPVLGIVDGQFGMDDSDYDEGKSCYSEGGFECEDFEGDVPEAHADAASEEEDEDDLNKICAKDYKLPTREKGQREEPVVIPPTVYFDSVCCQPNSYPGYCPVPRNIAVVGSESGTYESICSLVKTGFKCADRVLTMTPWGNYVVFKSIESYFLFDGCTCNVQKFRHLDLRRGTAGLLCFDELHDLVNHILNGQECRQPMDKDLKILIDEICNEYGN